MNEKHLALFTRVEDGLPEDDRYVLAIDEMGFDHFTCLPFLKHIKYWLDLSKLIKKENLKDISLIAEAKEEYAKSIDFEDFDDLFLSGTMTEGDINKIAILYGEKLISSFTDQNKERL